LANAFCEYGFWLADALLLVVSNGFTHKKNGQSRPRGAWESVKRQFKEIWALTVKQPISLKLLGVVTWQ